jgi:hypothetical protein
MTTQTRFPRPELVDDGMTLKEVDWRLAPKKFAKKRAAVAAALEAFLPHRFVLVVGVTKKLQVASGDESGAMQVGRAYQINRSDFIKMKLDPKRSPHLVCLEPKVPNMYFEVCRAINQGWPHQARNTFLATA